MKEKQIFNLFEFLSNNNAYYSNTKKVRDHLFTSNDSRIYSVFAADLAAEDKRDSCDITFDFVNKKIDLYLYNESYHNGDPRNIKEVSIPWSKLEFVYPNLYSIAEYQMSLELKARKVDEEIMREKIASANELTKIMNKE